MIDQDKIGKLAAASALARYKWKGRGQAPIGYIKGMAISYAHSLERLREEHPAVKFMAQADTYSDGKDAISWYRSKFKAIGLKLDAGRPTLLALYVMLTGLGMRESSGKYCEGRDRSASNTSAGTCEAGLFQQSWNSQSSSSHIRALLDEARDNPYAIPAFREDVKCSASDLACFGKGDGRRFQVTAKAFPFFAVEAAGVGLRVIRRHWGPINRREVEIRPEAANLFKLIGELIWLNNSATPPPKS